MSVYLNKINNNLSAIEKKDLEKIISENIYIPYLGNKYTKDELQTWLDKRSDFLKQAKIVNESQLNSGKDVIYQSLSVSQKRMADKILDNKMVENETEEDWEKLVLIRLYKFITTL